MCLAVPALVKTIDGIKAEVEIDGVSRNISTYLTPDVAIGDYVLLHAGFSIKIIDRKEAEETLNIFRSLDEISRRFSQS